MEENIKPKKKWGARKIVSLVLFVIILSAIVYWAGIQYSEWWKVRKQYIDMGFASDKFPYRMFTERELVERGLWSGESPALNAVPTRTTPEETYAKFRQALIDWDIDKAVECFVKEKKEEWRKSLYEIKEKGYLLEMLNDLPEKLEDTYIYTEDITQEKMGVDYLSDESSVIYYYVPRSDSKKIAQTMKFIKNWRGDWEIGKL
jgi:hypothetical protein